MWWIVAVVLVVAVLGFFEWRSRNKPLASGLRDQWGPHNAAHNEFRAVTGGHDTDKRD